MGIRALGAFRAAHGLKAFVRSDGAQNFREKNRPRRRVLRIVSSLAAQVYGISALRAFRAVHGLKAFDRWRSKFIRGAPHGQEASASSAAASRLPRSLLASYGPLEVIEA